MGPEIIAAVIGVLGGYAISRVCWARHVDERLTRLEDSNAIMLDQQQTIMDHFGLIGQKAPSRLNSATQRA